MNRTLRAFNSNKNKRYPDEPEGGWVVIDLDEDSPALDDEGLQVSDSPASPEEEMQHPGGPGEPG